ncbi:MAG: FAD-dependent oxidoreductase [Streptosporangiales bacterium]|nr:FAD-dependent oxidoreductase [Streptosporangiales bacterium]
MDLVHAGRGPRTAVVVGAGVVGLSTAWFLQQHGLEVTVVDRREVAAGASWGNAGWLSPALAIPLNEPSVVRYGLRALFDRDAPLHIPATLDMGRWRFLTRFAANCTWRTWERAMRANLPLNTSCLDAFDELVAGGVDATTTSAPVTAVFTTAAHTARLRRELDRMQAAGQPLRYSELAAGEVRDAVKQASRGIGAGVRIDGQRYVDPGEFATALGKSVGDRGASIRTGFDVVETVRRRHRLAVRSNDGESVKADVVVLATGAWLGRLGRRSGVRVPVRAGRGYSFTVPTDEPVSGPIYLPDVRVACTPYRGALRVAGTMEFRGPDDPLDAARIDAIVASVRPFLDGVRWDERTDEWGGPRPVTHDGRPLIGAAHPPGLYVAAGHGMWGLTQGPVTGRLLAEQITSGTRPAALHDCDPLR